MATNKQTVKQKAETYFKNKSLINKVHATSDGFLFEKKQDALSHAKTLDKKQVETFSRSVKVEDKVEAKKVEDAKKAEETKKAEEAKKNEEAKKTEEAKKVEDAKKAENES